MAAAEATHLIIFLILPILPVLFFTFLIKRRSSSPKAPPLPPGPRPWPIVGNLPHIGTKPHVVFAKLAQRHGPLISLRLGTQLVVVASSPAAAAEILKTHDRFLSGRYVPHASYAKNPDKNHMSFGFTFECNDHWKLLRTVCRTEIFSAKAVDGQAGIREKKADELVGFLSSKEGEAVRIAELVFVGVLNFLGTIFFSKEFIRLEGAGRGGAEINGHMKRLVEVLSRPNLSDFYPFLGGLDLQGLTKKFEGAAAQIFGAWEEILRERRRGGDSKMPATDFLDALLAKGFTDAQINYLFMELFVAGTDTTTSTIEWAMAELMRNPEAMQKLREELDQQIPTGDAIREPHLHNLSYLHACVKETLRLHPAAPLLLPRIAAQSCQVMGFTIPRNAQVFVNVWAIGRDHTIWENPLVFKPERFLLDSSLDFRGNDFEFLPFGGGRRICAGLLMAIRQIHLTLANLVYQFEWSLPDNALPQQLNMNEKFGVLLEKEQPLVVIPKRRR
ncbi:probable (S)-N-methylcoclaurine 3'-hydroxylase isozyme 2 [Diospyros lotus]|uniref:probable (S)-N-methylcoclaurine 3'-hydroxylase isozyme 2 n=1 Tax=Diospyros lotus TaxID=55363 RepID=UPI00224E0E1A|nr:probable (S)-N-methylcoclaurine 3'-hydroxylase isozyme 2 [Diospyros lotus]